MKKIYFQLNKAINGLKCLKIVNLYIFKTTMNNQYMKVNNVVEIVLKIEPIKQIIRDPS